MEGTYATKAESRAKNARGYFRFLLQFRGFVSGFSVGCVGGWKWGEMLSILSSSVAFWLG